MDERIEKWLYDIRQAIAEIDSYFASRKKDFNEYQKDVMLKRAIERNLEIIGEAVSRIIKADSSFERKIKSAKGIIGLRNVIIHAYDSVSDQNIWAILTNQFAKIKRRR